jgi:hypothetical protein
LKHLFPFLVFVPKCLKAAVRVQHTDDFGILIDIFELLSHKNILIAIDGFEILNCLGVCFDHLVDLFDCDIIFLQDIVTFKNALGHIFWWPQNAFSMIGRDGVFVFRDSGLPIPDRHVTLNK